MLSMTYKKVIVCYVTNTKYILSTVRLLSPLNALVQKKLPETMGYSNPSHTQTWSSQFAQEECSNIPSHIFEPL